MSSARRRPSPNRVEGQHGQEDRQNRKQDAVRRLVHGLPRIRDHDAPSGDIRFDREPDEAHDRLDDYGDTHFEAHQRDEQRKQGPAAVPFE